MKAFILLTVNPNYEENVANSLKEHPEVKQIYNVFGTWDLLAEVETDNIQLLNDFAVDKLRKVENITSSSTLVVAK
jgi:DNA-binding Lrp family transcriptional regulator